VNDLLDRDAVVRLTREGLAMMPPICEICGQRFDPDSGGGLIAFVRRPSDDDWHKRANEQGFSGHPPNMAWFCGAHFERAAQHRALTITEALPLIRE
jgi:hypothetical protein